VIRALATSLSAQEPASASRRAAMTSLLTAALLAGVAKGSTKLRNNPMELLVLRLSRGPFPAEKYAIVRARLETAQSSLVPAIEALRGCLHYIGQESIRFRTPWSISVSGHRCTTQGRWRLWRRCLPWRASSALSACSLSAQSPITNRFGKYSLLSVLRGSLCLRRTTPGDLFAGGWGGGVCLSLMYLIPQS
jgi:hypothetical protein